jgi:flavin-binding protein dodecin
MKNMTKYFKLCANKIGHKVYKEVNLDHSSKNTTDEYITKSAVNNAVNRLANSLKIIIEVVYYD